MCLPGAVEFVAAVASDAARSIEDTVARVLDKVAVARWTQFGTGEQLARQAAVLFRRDVTARTRALLNRSAARSRNVILVGTWTTRSLFALLHHNEILLLIAVKINFQRKQ